MLLRGIHHESLRRDRGRLDRRGIKHVIALALFDIDIQIVDGLHASGYTDLSVQKLIEMWIHGVTPEFIKEIAIMGYNDIPVEKLVEMKIHGISPEYARAMNAAFRNH